MTRATTGHPARAQRIVGVALALWLTYRAPAIEAAFDATLADLAAVPARAARTGPAAVPAEVGLVVPVAVPRRRATVHPVPASRPVVARAVVAAPMGAARTAVAVTRAARAGPQATIAAAEVAGLPLGQDPPTAGVVTPAGDLATAAYARLAAGDRRGAVHLFDAALDGDDPRAATWRRQRDALTRRWSASAYSLVRAGGAVDLAATPVLGGGQSGARLAYTLDPLSPRPLALTARFAAAHDDAGRSAVAAVGVEWRVRPGVTLAAERLIAVGPAAHDDWTVRVAGGADRATGRLRAAAYGEAGVVGRAAYAAGQARLGWAYAAGGVAVEPGVGAWASVQHDRATVTRVDLGPGVAVRAGPLGVALDYRVRVAGNAAPGTGPVLTLSAAF